MKTNQHNGFPPRDPQMVSCYDNDCLEEAVVECKECDGEFCQKHYQEGHPNGVCKFV